MAQYSWATCPTATRVQINTFCENLRTILDTQLIGIYLHGSLAMGCFNPTRSDIDMLVVTQQALSVFVKRQLVLQLLQASNQPHPIEISFLVAEQINPYQHPLPFDLHYSETWREQNQAELVNGAWQHWNERRGTDIDLDAHITILQQRGITLYGQEHQQIFPEIPIKHYIAAIIDDYYGARETKSSNSVYFLLNTCRIHAYLQSCHIYSKDEGGVYGLTTLPVEFIGLITLALDIYRGRSAERKFEPELLDRFTTYMDNYIHEWQQA
ncbi:aminoglycoside adenylyltransferase domain-containing protein [Dictyobacter formicarum]|uniref:Streptomycin 3''-adenylyltransferase n=1 Tax=Dictyobacter formicarum TaxID=2778368 RepID=A0ABQ3VD75_9CHLR|nr:aminoglycoside adenylyltransferase domain-containing protein [Dictyobacter formicarum]GHO83758.1 streptomycin 3''-adenylyltransferase [Dictyobacter formicarum]